VHSIKFDLEIIYKYNYFLHEYSRSGKQLYVTYTKESQVYNNAHCYVHLVNNDSVVLHMSFNINYH
jgi:competence transcription factor ComK